MSVADPIKKLFQPIKINQLEIRNRIVMPAMHLGYTPGGLVSDRLIDFYWERAKGGVGLIVIGGCTIDEYGGMPEMIGLHDDRFIQGLDQAGRIRPGGRGQAFRPVVSGRPLRLFDDYRPAVNSWPPRPLPAN